MKMKRRIALLLIAVMTLTLVCSCKSKDNNDEAVIDDYVEQKDNDIDDKDINTSPGGSDEPDGSDEPADDGDEPAKGDDDGDEPADDGDEPSDDGNEPADDGDEPANDGDEPAADNSDPAPVTKESSGTAITFMVQNLKTSGNQKGVQGERTDTLERTGQANEVYSRSRRFRENVKRVDPDVILTCEGTPAWIDWFETDSYFSSNYTLLYMYRAPEGFEINQATPLLYKTNKYTVVESGHFWHSETPKKQSLCYDTEGYRVATWALLKDNKTGDEFYAYTCHIDNNSYDGGTAGISTMEQYQTMLSQLPEDSFAFVGGDYNISYQDAIYEMTMDWERMIDLKDQALNMKEDGLAEIGGNSGSVNTDYEKDKYGGLYGTPPIQDAPNGSSALDHLMAKPNANMAVDYWGYDYTTTALPEENVAEGYVSDHYAVVVKVRINTTADYSQYQVQN
ncbi:MAG: hypothetical protein IJ407_04770 [Clostridia bacterium]|nr:hypothetical protein [Clostridia bacterium]